MAEVRVEEVVDPFGYPYPVLLWGRHVPVLGLGQDPSRPEREVRVDYSRTKGRSKGATRSGAQVRFYDRYPNHDHPAGTPAPNVPLVLGSVDHSSDGSMSTGGDPTTQSEQEGRESGHPKSGDPISP